MNEIIVGSIVDYQVNPHTVFGKVKSIDGTEVTVSFREANLPTVCARCGNFSQLSVNGGTGEIECLASGCGHEHGFKEWEEKHPISKLTLAPDKLQPK
jgi:ribosomal protein S27E